MVHDCRPVNEATVDSAAPCHDIDQNLAVMGTGRPRVYFQTDASNGFWAIRIYPPHQDRAGVVTPGGLYQYVRLAQGLKGWPQTYRPPYPNILLLTNVSL